VLALKFIRQAVALTTLLSGGALLAAPAHAVLITGDIAASTGQTGSNFTGDLTYSFSSSTSATLTLNLTNTTPVSVGGFLTGFALNNPDGNISSIDLTSAPTAAWTLLGLSDSSVTGVPYGQFDFGSTSGTGGLEGGGDPSTGLGVGVGGTFVFGLVGTNLNTLTDLSFVNEFSSGTGTGEGVQFFVARFRGLTGGGSDKVPGIAVVPEPSTYAMLLAGLGIVVVSVARRTA
jgi:hypothetical protein